MWFILEYAGPCDRRRRSAERLMNGTNVCPFIYTRVWIDCPVSTFSAG
jgi:hypothetical protein